MILRCSRLEELVAVSVLSLALTNEPNREALAPPDDTEADALFGATCELGSQLSFEEPQWLVHFAPRPFPIVRRKCVQRQCPDAKLRHRLHGSSNGAGPVLAKFMLKCSISCGSPQSAIPYRSGSVRRHGGRARSSGTWSLERVLRTFWCRRHSRLLPAFWHER